MTVGQTIKLDGHMPPRGTGRLQAQVLLADITYANGKPKSPVVGRFTRQVTRAVRRVIGSAGRSWSGVR